MATEQMYLVTLNVGGIDCGVYDKMTGGDTSVSAAKHRPGGMGPEKSYRTLPTFADITLTRVMERARDWELMRSLMNQSGKARAIVTKQPLDDDGNAWGTPMTFYGRLGPVKGGGADSGSSNPSMYEVDVFVESRA